MASPGTAPEGGVLGRILEATRARVQRLKTEVPVARLREGALYGRRPADFRRALLGGSHPGSGPRVIAEIKFASPSRGLLHAAGASSDEAARIASDYLANGAAALSVLTEPDFFQGSLDFLRRIRKEHPAALLLMKDFVIDLYQLEQARWAGADAVLLIVAALGRRLETLLCSAEALGLSALVEVHAESELSAARKAGATLVGVNSRDLRTLKTDLAVARSLASLPKALTTAKGRVATLGGPVLVAESGIRARQDIESLSACGYRGFLVGTSLMASGHPGRALKELLS